MDETAIKQNEEKTIGVDIGGTKISAGLVENGNILSSVTFPTPVNGKREDVIDLVVMAINMVINEDVAGIGVGIPGLVNTSTGTVYDVQNIPSFTNVPLKEILEKKLGKAVFLNNDANCFALGASNFGNGKFYNNMVGLTLGTGLGGGVVLHGHLYEGTGCGAGEFGYLPYRDGILEHYCSGQFFQRQYDITGKEAYALALESDEKALRMFNHFGYHLGEAIKMIAHVFAPEAVILGGSISRDFDFFQQSMWRGIRQFPYKHVIDNLTVLPAVNPEIAIVGAAYLVGKLN